MALEDIFSGEHLKAYGETCTDLALDILNKLPNKDFNTLIIPSRGAVPIFLGMLYALKCAGESPHKLDHEEILSRRLGPFFDKTALNIAGKTLNVLLCPFTADLNLKNYNPILDENRFINKTRQYWAHVTASFYLPPGERKHDPYFRSYVNLILKEVESRPNLAQAYEDFPQIKKAVMIDTVISGRASSTILNCFDKLAKERQNPALIPYSFLIIDENGKKLKPCFESVFKKKESERLLTRLHMPRIISEDEGASLEGVCAVVYPTIMDLSRKLTYKEGEFFIGAGSWHSMEKVPYYCENFKAFMKMIKESINLVCAGSGDKQETDFKNKLTDFIKFLKQRGVLASHNGNIKELRLNPKIKFDSLYETNAHVVHAIMPVSQAQRLLSNFVTYNPEVSYKKED